jgi:hypothetical protein
VVVRVSNNGVDFPPHGVKVTHVHAVGVVQVFPLSVPSAGGSPVMFTVSTAPDALAGLRCVFDGADVAAVVDSKGTTVTCSAPPRAPGLSKVDLVQGTAAGTGRFNVLYYTPPTLLAVSPNVASEAGGRVVYVSGSGFQGASQMSNVAYVPGNASCVFAGAAGTVRTPATVLTDSLLACTAPPSTPQAATLAVSLNGFDLSPHALPFTFTPQVTVAKVTPGKVSTRGDTEVTLLGTSFSAIDGLTCVFGGVRRPVVRVVSETQIVCVAPAHPAGNVSVTVSAPGLGDAPGAVLVGWGPARGS